MQDPFGSWDGASTGTLLALSLAWKVSINPTITMSGELCLNGEVGMIGCKLAAAKAAGVTTLILLEKKEGVSVIFVENYAKIYILQIFLVFELLG